MRRVSVSVPEETAEAVEQLAAERGLSVSGLYAEAAQSLVREERREAAYEAVDRLIGTVDVDEAAFEREQAAMRRDDAELLIRIGSI